MSMFVKFTVINLGQCKVLHCSIYHITIILKEGSREKHGGKGNIKYAQKWTIKSTLSRWIKQLSVSGQVSKRTNAKKELVKNRKERTIDLMMTIPSKRH